MLAERDVREGEGMRGLIEDGLRLSASIVLAREEVVPRFRIEVPGERGFVLFVPLPDDEGQRRWRMGLVSAFMAWKGAHAFVFSSELKEPDAALSCAVSREGVIGAVRLIVRRPLSVGPVEWLSRAQLGDEVPGLLPPKAAVVTPATMRI